jgi:putative flippase GtrA
LNQDTARLRKQAKQVIRYGLVGALTNGLAFFGYLVLVSFKLTPEISAFLLYIIAAVTGYFANYRWTFNSNEIHRKAMPKFLFSHLIGATSQYAIIAIVHRGLRLPHQLAQIISLGCVSILLYLLLNIYVFSPASTPCSRPRN